ncbi:MAG: prephenate dehydratase [Promethearchaeota archaeon]
MEEINKLRKKIDEIDSKLAELIGDRAQIAENIGEIKSQEGIGVVQPGREKDVLKNVKDKLSGIFPPESAEAIWKEIMSACKLVQGKTTNICYLGPKGTFTQIAAEKFFPKAGSTFLPAANKKEVFNKVEGDYVQFGVIPIENSLSGSVRESIDLLIEKNLKICGETEIRVLHNLIGHKGTAPSDVKTIISHPQALAQCNTWLLKSFPNADLVEASSTARAVEKVATMKIRAGEYAAIGTNIAAKMYGLEIFNEGIEDNTQNYTRFLIISKKEKEPTDHDKTSIVFVTSHKPGSLHHVIKLFAEAEINLLKIESRPRKNTMWEYVFLLAFDGNQKDPLIEKTLEKVREHTIWMKILGSYPISGSH